MVKKIITDINLLRRQSKLVEQNDPQIRTMVQDLRDTLIKNMGVGLNQIQICSGEEQPKQIFVFLDSDLQIRVVINPEVLYQNKIVKFLGEGCLSFPNFKKPIIIARSYKIKVKYFDEKWNEQIRELKFPSSNIFLHEFDHGLGKLIVDYATQKY